MIKKYLKIIYDSKFILALNLTDKIFFFIIFAILARNYKTEIYGEIVTLMTLCTIFLTIYDFGLPLFMQKEIASSPATASKTFSMIFTINLVVFIIYSLTVSAFYYIVYFSVPFGLFIIIVILMYESSLTNICNKALSGVYGFKKQFTALWVSRIYTLLFFLIGIYIFKLEMLSLMAIILSGFFMNLVFLFYYLKIRKIIFSPGFFNWNSAKSVLKFSIPLGMTVLFNFLYDKVDLLLISKLKGFSDAAYYNIGYGIYKGAALSFSFILVSGYTRVSRLSSNKAAVSLFFRKYFKLILIICVCASVILFFISGIIIPLIYTEQYIPSINVIKILSLALIALGLNNLTGVILNGIGLFKVVMYITLFGFIINILLNILFIPRFGITASSVITVFTEYFIFIFELYYLIKVLKKK